MYEAGINIEVVLIVGQGKDLIQQLNSDIKVHYINRRSRFDVKAAYQLVRILRKADIAHIHMRHNYRYVALVTKLFCINTPLLFHDHYGKINIDQQVPTGFNSITKPEWYIGVSQTLTSWAEKKLKLSNSQVFVLENVAPARSIYGNTPSKKADLVLVSNIKPQKNQVFALQLVKKSNWTLDIYGSRQDEKYAVTIEKEIKSQHPDDRIRLYHHCNNVQEILKDYSLGLHTSVSETGPLVIIEYLAQGLPFLAYRTGEAAEKIRQELPDLFIDNFDIDEWIDRINKILNNPPHPDKMAQVFEKHFSKQAYIEKCLSIYRHVLHS